MPPCPQPSPAKLSWRHRVFCLLGHCQGFLCPVRVRKHRANPHPQDLREDRSPLQAGAHRPHRQALRPAVVEGCGVPEKWPLSRRLRARRLPGSPEDGRFCVACGRDTPGGSPEDDRLRAAVGKTPPGAAKPADFVLLRVGAALGDLRKRPFSSCYARARAGLLRKRPKVCALIQQGAADPCFVALAICITPGRWRARFRAQLRQS